MANYEVVKREGGAVIASNGKNFFCCFQYKNGVFHRACRGGSFLSVEDRDLDYIAIGARKFSTLEAAARAGGFSSK